MTSVVATVGTQEETTVAPLMPQEAARVLWQMVTQMNGHGVTDESKAA